MYPLVCVLVSIAILFADGMHNGHYNEQETNTLYHSPGPIVDGPSFRYFRNIYQGGRPQNNDVRFGWQNPIRVAPTLPPPQSYPTTPRYSFHPTTTTPRYSYPTTTPWWRTTTEYFIREPIITSGSNQNNKYVEPPENRPVAQAQIGRCPDGSRRDKQSRQCLPLGGSCGENMEFYEDPTDKEYGQCDCIQNANRPLTFHPKNGKCYFLFQQAFCEPNQWLIVDTRPGSQPTCSLNTCSGWTFRRINPDWNWEDNGAGLDKTGTVALLNEKTCTLLGWPCTQEARQYIANSLVNSTSGVPRQTGIILAFDGPELVCRGENRNENQGNYGRPRGELSLSCKPGLFNKWRLDGRCRK